jgi:hypothetical protein
VNVAGLEAASTAPKLDLRRDHDDGALVHPLRGLFVLDQLEHVGAVHDVPWRDRDVAADLERPGVDL